jgi:FlaG/FlaF family flagellin (archaellin)
VIGTFVLGLGDQVQDSAPNANLQFDYDPGSNGAFGSSDASVTDDGDEIAVTSTGGDDISTSTLTVQVGGTDVYTSSSVVADPDTDSTNDIVAGSQTWGGTISAGSAQVIQESENTGATDYIESGETVRIVWQSPNGGSSQTIGESEVPS